MSAPFVHYEFHVKLKPFHKEHTKFLVLFLFGEVNYLLHSTEGRMEFRREREPLIVRKLAQIPIGDSLVDHIQNFKDILTRRDIPEIEQSKILDEIAAKALDMDTYSGTFMSVRIVAVKNGLDEDIARAERESMGIEARPIPATKSSIDALERVDFDGSASARDCTVCMEEIEAGSEAIRMPCSHVYHSDCIVQWLQTSHFCPLCRYHMPCEF